MKRFFFLTLIIAQFSFSAMADDKYLTNHCSRYFSLYESQYSMPKNLLRAIGKTESGRWVKSLKTTVPWPWTVNAGGKGYFFKTKEEAVNAVKKFQKQGIKLIDVGCMQINLHYHGHAFNNLHQAFEPYYNVGYAAGFLREKYALVKNWKKAVSKYHSHKPVLGKRYLARVMKKWNR